MQGLIGLASVDAAQSSSRGRPIKIKTKGNSKVGETVLSELASSLCYTLGLNKIEMSSSVRSVRYTFICCWYGHNSTCVP